MLPAAIPPRVEPVNRGEAVQLVRKRAAVGYRKVRRKAGVQLLAWQARQRAKAKTPSPAARFLPGAQPDDSERLVPSPVFLLSSIRSGSTLLRLVLDSHPQICAPHEMHLRHVKVNLSNPNAAIGMKECGLSARDLENLLWDRVLHLSLVRSGKSIVVDKTPHNVRDWQRLLTYWPEARYLFLYRHPAALFDSMKRAWPKQSDEHHYEVTTEFARHLAAARAALPGLTLRYEDFVADPVGKSKELCEWLGVEWDEAMLNYADQDRGEYRSRLGDWSETVKSGKIRPPQPLPDTPDELREACELLGY